MRETVLRNEVRAEKPALRHREMLFERLKKLAVGLSDYSFANLYLFRKPHDFEIVFDDKNGLWIRGKTFDGIAYMMPTVDVRALDTDHLKKIVQDARVVYPVPEQWLEKFPADEFDRAWVAGDSDYIYRAEKMAVYPGSKLHKKRNLLKQFMAAHESRMEPLVGPNLPEAVGILEEWQKESGSPSAQTDYHPCLEALEMSEELALCGAIYYADDEPAGFIVGEELTADMFVVKFAKAKKKFKGIYQFLFHHFARRLPPKYHYLNFESDLGKQALRLAKSSYAPETRLIKYRITLK